MKFSIRNRYTKEIIVTVEYEKGHNEWLLAVQKALEIKADLRWADLRWADLRCADLTEANLTKADLRWANLTKADLRWADLTEADLRWADLRWADLRCADLTEANLTKADLRWANLDFSSGFTFACKTFHIKAELHLAAQLAYHFCRFDFGDCEEAKQAQTALKSLANKFHRAGECGLIE